MRDHIDEVGQVLDFMAMGNVDLKKYMLPREEQDKILPVSAFTSRVTDYFHGEHQDYGKMPWPSLDGKVEIRPGEVSVYAGSNGHGKSLLHGLICLSLAAQGQSVVIASMEMPPVTTVARLIRQGCLGESPSPEWISRFMENVQHKIRLYDHNGTVKPETMIALARYCREEMKVDHIVIDSLMKCGISADDYNRQKWFMDELTTYARDSGLHIHLIAHSRKKDTERAIIDKYDIKGTSEITDMADNVFSVWRNKKKEADAQKPEPSDKIQNEPDALLICDKQRHGEWEGRVGLWFLERSLQYVDRPKAHAVDILGLG